MKTLRTILVVMALLFVTLSATAQTEDKDAQIRQLQATVNMQESQIKSLRAEIKALKAKLDGAEEETTTKPAEAKPEVKKSVMTGKLVDRMARTLPKVSLDSVTLESALDFLKNAVSCKIEADWASLKKLGVEPTDVITIHLESPTANEVVAKILNQLNNRGTIELSINGSNLYFGEERQIVKTYPVGDILAALKKGAEVTLQSTDMPTIQAQLAQDIEQMSGIDLSADDGVLEVRGTGLFVRTSLINHSKVSKAIADLRGKIGK